MSHYFRKSDFENVELELAKYFIRQKLNVTVRTLNVMMEGYRASGDYSKSSSYFNLFQTNKLQLTSIFLSNSINIYK